MPNNTSVFSGCMPALMTPCDASGNPDFEVLAKTGQELIREGMSGVVYCGSMGDWTLLNQEQRKCGVEALISAAVPVVVGTGAQNPQLAVELAEHAKSVQAAGLMVIPRVLSRGSSTAAQYNHFDAILSAASGLPSVIYNSPYYGFETKAELFFKLRNKHANLVGFKEFGGAQSLSYAAEHITTGRENLALMVGVDTQVVHGFVKCRAVGAITGVGNAMPTEILHLVKLCQQARTGDSEAFRFAHELDDALSVLSKFDEGPDLVLYYKHLMTLVGHPEYRYNINPDDQLSASQKAFIELAFQQFTDWWHRWDGANYQ